METTEVGKTPRSWVVWEVEGVADGYYVSKELCQECIGRIDEAKKSAMK